MPINIIIYIKYDDENNINNVCYPITMNLADKTPNSNYLFYLKAVIQQNIKVIKILLEKRIMDKKITDALLLIIKTGIS